MLVYTAEFGISDLGRVWNTLRTLGAAGSFTSVYWARTDRKKRAAGILASSSAKTVRDYVEKFRGAYRRPRCTVRRIREGK